MANFGKIMQLFDNLTREITVGIYTVTGRLEMITYNCYSNSNDMLQYLPLCMHSKNQIVVFSKQLGYCSCVAILPMLIQ